MAALRVVIISCLVAGSLGFSLSSLLNRKSCFGSLDTVPELDVQQYLGRWYQVT